MTRVLELAIKKKRQICIIFVPKLHRDTYPPVAQSHP